MTPYYADDRVTLHHGDALEVLRTLPDASVDAVVTDPPYGLEFMGREWDSFKPSAARLRTRVDGRTNPAEGKSLTTTPEAYVAGAPFQRWCEAWATECLRVLKPGGHLLAFGGTRTVHRLTCAIEDAGFEIRDGIDWLYGSGFPKSLNLGDGRGTALKPAREPIVMARKPLAGTVAANVLAYGTGALNIDACRVPAVAALVRPAIRRDDNDVLGKGLGVGTQDEPGGRWPSNVVLSHAPDCGEACVEGCPVAELDQDSGGASRFFPVFRYQAKAPTRERPKVDGIAHPTVKPLALMRWLVRLVTPPGGVVLEPFAGSGTTVEACLLEGFRCVAIEREATYLPLIEARLNRLSPADQLGLLDVA